MQETETCVLCGHAGCAKECDIRQGRYFRCPECSLVFIAPECLPDSGVEMARYLRHTNSAEDEGYVQHLLDISDRVTGRVPAGSTGLDFGSGPQPVMAEIMRKRGFSCEAYDPLFSPDSQLLRRVYDFVLCCEVAEHFHAPSVDFVKMFNLLDKGGLLGLKTSLLEPGVDLSGWHYANDPTHVCFYSDETFDWITNRFGFLVEDRDAGRIVWRKAPAGEPLIVTAGIIRNGDRILVAARNSGELAGKWEFPGGKLKEGEEAGRGLVREIREELGIEARTGPEIARLQVPGKRGLIELCFIEAQINEEPRTLTSHSKWMWVSPSDLKGLLMPAGDRAFADIWMQY